MKQCVDSEGRIIQGLFRDPTGALIVSDPASYHKYRMQRDVVVSKDKKIADLETKVDKLTSLVEQLLQNKV